MKNILIITGLTALFLMVGLVGVSTVLAHSFGKSIEKEVDGYLVDIGYNAQSFEAGDPVRLDLNLLKDGDPVEFSDVWLRINKGPKTIIAGNLGRPPLGKTGITLVMPEGGDYTFNARFMNDGETIVEFSDSLSVSGSAGGSSQSLTKLIIIGIIGVLAGFSTSYFVTKK